MSTLATVADAEMSTYRALQETISKLRTQQQTLLQQSNENDMVLSEINLLDGKDKLFKLVGPVLIEQAADEGKETVEKRIEFITGTCQPTTTPAWFYSVFKRW